MPPPLHAEPPDARSPAPSPDLRRTNDAFDPTPDAALRPDAVAAARVAVGPAAAPPPGAATLPFVPCLRLFADTVVVGARAPWEDPQELKTGVAALSFDYGGTRVRAGDSRPRFFRMTADGPLPVARAVEQEREARRLLESFGAIEAGCLDSAGESGAADYVLDAEADVHALCTFTAYAVPQLRARGVQVEIDPDYPWQTVGAESGWYAAIDEDGDWFSLELGVEIEGRRQNLLPILLDLLENAPPGLDLDSLARSRRRLLGLRLGGRQWLAIEPERLLGILRVLLELHEERDERAGRLRASALQAAALDELAGLFAPGALSVDGGLGLRHRARELATLGREPAWTPAGLEAILRPYQRRGLAWLTGLAELGLGGVLADDMGLGKTLQVIAHLLVERAAGRLTTPALVITPTSLAGNWQRELARFAPGLRVLAAHGPRRAAAWRRARDGDVLITTYAAALRDEDTLAELEPGLVVLDEAQAVKNPRSQLHQALRRLRANRRLCLTGTPLENNLTELWSVVDFAVPGLLGGAAAFREHFADPIEKDGSRERLLALRRRIAPFVLRREKREVVPELPAKTEIVRPVELSGSQRDLYETIRLAAHDQIRRAVHERGIARSAITILDALMKLRQVCCDPRLLRLDAARGVRESAKYELLFDVLDAQLAQGHRVLVFSQFTGMLALIAKGLAERAVRHAILTGATTDREAQVDAFQARRAEVFLISLKAGGTGLNLTAADTVIHYDPWWNPAAQAQATGRAHRIGQLRPVFVYNLIVAGSVEERILGLQERKRELATALLAGTAEPTLALSRDEVEELLAPLEDEIGAPALVAAPAARACRSYPRAG